MKLVFRISEDGSEINDLTIAYFVSYVFAVRYNDRYVLFHDRHKFIGAGHFDRQVPKNYFQACLPGQETLI